MATRRNQKTTPRDDPLAVDWHVTTTRQNPGDLNSLDDAIKAFHRRGYRVIYRDESTVQLAKRKQFNTWAAMAWFLFFGFGTLLYIIYYLGQKDDLVLLTTGDCGSVEVLSDAPTEADTILGLAIIGAGILVVVLVIAFFAAV